MRADPLTIHDRFTKMSILAAEPNLFPETLFDRASEASDEDACWWVMYCLARQEKQLMRRLRALEVAHYCPLIAKRNRSPSGRIRTSYIPLFSGYTFVFGSNQDRYAAVATGCVSRCLEVADGALLRHDLQQIQELIALGRPLTPEARLLAGDRVRVGSGPFRGFEGVIIRRQNKTRLLVAVNYLQQGASMLLDDCQLEPL